MKPLLNNRKAIFLALAVLLLESFAGTCFFDALANACANYRYKLQTFVDNQRIKMSKPVSNSSLTVIDGSNGTKAYRFVFLEPSVSRESISVEYFDYSKYVEHMIFWETLKHSFDTIRDIHREMNEMLICTFCVISLGFGLKKLPRVKMINF
jgi:hypothetical protein